MLKALPRYLDEIANCRQSDLDVLKEINNLPISYFELKNTIAHV